VELLGDAAAPLTTLEMTAGGTERTNFGPWSVECWSSIKKKKILL